jgi:hypothetical protein
MQTIDLNELPDFAQRELMDFYYFLKQKYTQRSLEQAVAASRLAPRLVKPFKPLNREQLYER